jgi:hypothetical protein
MIVDVILSQKKKKLRQILLKTFSHNLITKLRLLLTVAMKNSALAPPLLRRQSDNIQIRHLGDILEDVENANENENEIENETGTKKETEVETKRKNQLGKDQENGNGNGNGTEKEKEKEKETVHRKRDLQKDKEERVRHRRLLARDTVMVKMNDAKLLTRGAQRTPLHNLNTYSYLKANREYVQDNGVGAVAGNDVYEDVVEDSTDQLSVVTLRRKVCVSEATNVPIGTAQML